MLQMYSYNKSQQDALFLNFILVKNSTCFGRAYCPSSGIWILYSQQLVFVIQLCWLYDKYQLLWIQYSDSWWWTVSPSETCRVLYKNKVEKLRILLAFVIRLYHDARSSECQSCKCNHVFKLL